MLLEQLKANIVVRGPIFPEPVQVLVVIPMGASVKLVGKGLSTGKVHEPILNAAQLAQLCCTADKEPFDGDPLHFRLGIEAMRLGLAYEYDPYFSLSIARVDPLPHQLEAVYDYFLKMPRIRFLLADDPGAGKTVMAGLLHKELKIRGLVKRTLIVTPANLSFQWQREMKDKFRETFEVVRGDVLRANHCSNPWQEKNQVITSVSWVSRIEDANESLMRSQWDLIIVDEAHKMSAASADKKTLAYELGEALSAMTDHYLLMTATPHKGDPKHFCLFLELLDKDVYGDVASLEEAMRRNSAPFYLRRTKEALVTFPDPETGQCQKLFTDRDVQTVEFQIDSDEWDFYDALTRYVDDQSIKAQADDSAVGWALSFTMAMLQRRFASSVYAVRRSLERMRDKRQKILDDPEAYRQEQITKKLPEDYEDLTDEEQKINDALEQVVASVDPAALKEEIFQIGKLIDQARLLEKREVESKLVALREVLTNYGIFKDPKMKLLIFTEHKDTLDYLAGDGKETRPLGKLRQWGLSVTQIHGGMKIGDRDTPGTRIYAEKEFRDDAQVLVATEAAGEGINLQFCWFMINYDIPWNPVRLEQRMGRIHRYGQEKDCLIRNFVSTNKRVDFTIVNNPSAKSVPHGTIARGSVTCPCCGYTTPVSSVRSQLTARHGASDDSRLFAVVVDSPSNGRQFRTATPRDVAAFAQAKGRLGKIRSEGSSAGSELLTEPLPPDGTLGFRVRKYGMSNWGHLFNSRQLLALSTYARLCKQYCTVAKLIWTGTIPAQKWMNFYTKVLSKFAASKGLSLSLTVEATPEGGISKQKIDETKVALGELGLEDDVSTG